MTNPANDTLLQVQKATVMSFKVLFSINFFRRSHILIYIVYKIYVYTSIERERERAKLYVDMRGMPPMKQYCTTKFSGSVWNSKRSK